MKTTLENSYCKPKTEAEWKSLTSYSFWFGYNGNEFIDGFECIEAFKPMSFTKAYVLLQSDITELKTEIPVQNFIDLVDDKTYSLFRLIEAGFHNSAFDYYDVVIPKEDKIWQITVAKNGKVTLNGELTNIANFTELLTLIRFLK